MTKPVRMIGKARSLHIHIAESDTYEAKPLYEAIVERARAIGIAGATVYRGILGYGAHRHVHAHKSLSWKHDDPVMIEIVDIAERVDLLVAALDDMVTTGCVMTMSDVTVARYTTREENV